jgi:hypothetical protein
MFLVLLEVLVDVTIIIELWERDKRGRVGENDKQSLTQKNETNKERLLVERVLVYATIDSCCVVLALKGRFNCFLKDLLL